MKQQDSKPDHHLHRDVSVALGILIGALVGARLLAHLSNRILRIIFLTVIIVAAIEMVLHGVGIA